MYLVSVLQMFSLNNVKSACCVVYSSIPLNMQEVTARSTHEGKHNIDLHEDICQILTDPASKQEARINHEKM